MALTRLPLLLAALALSCAACANDTFSSSDARLYSEAGTVVPGQCTPGQDTDGDSIDDEIEGCGSPPRDTDNDGVPDYADADSDGDGVADGLEGAADTDGDGAPDFQDKDSDGDNIGDGDEDIDKDGHLGCCLSRCDEVRPNCQLEASGCGPGQTCNAGNCEPPVDFQCSNGETDPKKKITFPGGVPDDALPTFICRNPDELSAKGLKPIDYHQSVEGNWQLALERGVPYGPLQITSPAPLEAAAVFEFESTDQQVAGFIFSFASSETEASIAATGVMGRVSSIPGASEVMTISSGNLITSHDAYPTVVSIELTLQSGAAQKPGVLRDKLVAAGLGKTLGSAGNTSYGDEASSWVVRMQVQLRRDEGRVIVLGGLASAALARDEALATTLHLEDISNGTGLATPADSETVECDPFVPDKAPIADIIWVIDESGSMGDNRDELIANARDFFARAMNSGLDFRMGVAGMAAPHGTVFPFPPIRPANPPVNTGKLCGKMMPPYNELAPDVDDGGPDRFLAPQEALEFSSCILNPPYNEGGTEYSLAHTLMSVAKHLPRTANDETKLRPEATTVVIVATDETPVELKGSEVISWCKNAPPFPDPAPCPITMSYPELSEQQYTTCTLDAGTQAEVDAYIKPWIDLFTGNDPAHGEQGQAILHVIGGLCSSSCDAVEMAHGLLEVSRATGGIQADVCQKDLGSTLQLIIDSISGAASPMVLEYVPISASLAAALNNQQLPRSRVKGFDYVGASNSIIFSNIPKIPGAQVVISYRRWVRQETIN